MAISSDLRQLVLRQAQGALSLDLAYIGVTNGLFVALSGDGASLDTLAAQTGRDVGYVRRWADAAWAFGLIERDGSTSPSSAPRSSRTSRAACFPSPSRRSCPRTWRSGQRV